MCKKRTKYDSLKRTSQLFILLLGALLLTAFKNSIDAELPFQPITTTPQRVALLLPLEGEYKPISQAIQTGFLEANAAFKSPLTIKIIDTYKDNTLQKSYRAAKKWKADLLIGPLLKPDVKTLAQFQALTRPVLTLNYLSQKEESPANFYQFGLSPFDEATQITQHAKANEHQSALILVPDNEWGAELAEHFTSHWEHLGGKVSGLLRYSNTVSLLNREIRKFLEFSPPNKRREDFDVIFIAASGELGRQINPLLAFYFASNVPIYATTSIYDPKLPRHLNRDLDDMILADTPWSMGIQDIYPAIRTRCFSKSPKHFEHYAKYYALGADAFLLAMELAKLDEDKDKIIQGTTGDLSLNEDRYVIRRPLCAQLKKGTLTPLLP